MIRIHDHEQIGLGHREVKVNLGSKPFNTNKYNFIRQESYNKYLHSVHENHRRQGGKGKKRKKKCECKTWNTLAFKHLCNQMY